MNSTFKRFKIRQYITRKWGVLLLAFIISIGTTSIPVNADSESIANQTTLNDTEYPVVTVQRYFINAEPGKDYLISVTAGDNKGIQDVTITYTIVNNDTSIINKTISDQKMTLNTKNNRYEYTIPGKAISSSDLGFKFYITATDVTGLQTITDTSEVNTIGIFENLDATPSSFYDYPHVYITNPTEYPVIIVPDYLYSAIGRHEYTISVDVQDNTGIQDVTVDYNIGYKSFPGFKMTKDSYTGRYQYIIPEHQILATDPSFNFTVTATNVAGLKTTTDGSAKVNVNTDPDLSMSHYYDVTAFTHDENNSFDNNNSTSQLPNDISTIKDISMLKNGPEEVTVAGQIAYFATDSVHPVIQAVIDGMPYSLYIKSTFPDITKIGYKVKVTGTYTMEHGLPMLKDLTNREVIGYDTPMTPEIVTIADLKENGLNMLGRFVKIKNVKLGTYKVFSNTEITDGTGSINIYNAVAYPPSVGTGDIVDLYAIVACNGSTVQLYTGTKAANDYSVYHMVTDTKPPLITLSDKLPEAQLGRDYFISSAVEDNEGIQDVNPTYTINGKMISNQKMIQNTYNGNYDYRISSDHFLETTSNFVFTITATDANGLKTVSKTTTVNVNNQRNPFINAFGPGLNLVASKYETLPIQVSYENAGKSPIVTYTLKNDTETIFTDKEMISSGNSAYDNPDLPAVGNYTVLVKVTRSEDGKVASQEWHFTISE